MYSNVFIMLGSGCNFNCKYCLQHPILTKPLCTTISTKLKRYLLQMTPPKNEKIRMTFFGGEPLLYWDNIVELVELLKPTGSFNFGIISNGALLTEEMVAYLNENEISFSVSNDGPNTEKYRSENVLENERLLTLFKQIKRFSLSAVMHAQNADFHAIWDYFESKGFSIEQTNIDLIMDTGINVPELTDFDFDQLEQTASEFEEEISHSLVTGEPAAAMYYANPLISRIREIVGKDNDHVDFNRLQNIKCGAGTKTLNVDLKGNCYLCHNSSTRIGTIDNSYEELAEAFKPYDKYSKSTECDACPAQILCSGGCLLVGPEARERYYCRMNRIIFSAIINALLRYEENQKQYNTRSFSTC